MREHRLIEQIIGALELELEHIEKENTVHPAFIYLIVDFFRTYADKFHHGKEEDILFSALKTKNLTEEHQKILEELIAEHVIARETVGTLVSATEEWRIGDTKSIVSIAESLNKLCKLYPNHIEKEDRHFFIPCQSYFSKQERESLLEMGFDFDQKFTTNIYEKKMKTLLQHKVSN